MLQQTQVETVRDYYLRFMERFPTVADLAAAPLEAVLKLWEGWVTTAGPLAAPGCSGGDGALRRSAPCRCRGLVRAAGRGAYTAGAIASLAFGISAPAVDGNVRRVLARVLAQPSPTAVQLEEASRLLLPPEAPGAFNEALIELGATLCRPQNPTCLLCPWRDWCLACQTGQQEAFPAPKPVRRCRTTTWWPR
jgi:A/G-specific adenine glycosylase